MGEDINEVLRSADFEELVHRVDIINKMEYKGRVDVNMGYDHKEESTVVQTEHNSEEADSKQSDTQIMVSPSSFGSVLRTPQDLIQIGLYMQKGIHSSLDGIQEVDLEYLDKKITEKLDSLGVGKNHTLLYIRSNGDTKKLNAQDTLAKFGNAHIQRGVQFSLDLPNNASYQMIIPQWHVKVMKKMAPMIIFSLVTFLLLCISFLYIIRMMKRQKEFEEIKMDFTNNITHELKTPIAVAYAANDALLNYNSENNSPRVKRYLGVSLTQLRLLDRLVEQILSLSMERKQSMILNVENINVNELFQSLIETYKMRYPDKVDFHISLSEPVTLASDYMHISNIIGNLIDNSIKYSKGKAEVTLSAVKMENGEVIIEVKDKGIGMTADQCQKIFDKFYRVPHGNLHDVKGYGLGLFYVKSMTEKLGGKVSVQSKFGVGSTFRLSFKCN